MGRWLSRQDMLKRELHVVYAVSNRVIIRPYAAMSVKSLESQSEPSYIIVI